MKIAEVEMVSDSPYSQSRYHQVEKLDKELPDDYERRTWRERCHFDEKGNVFIPPTAFSNCLKVASHYLNVKIPGRRNETYSKHFDAGILVQKPLVLPWTRDSVKPEWVFVPADGKRGGGKRVMKCFPLMTAWRGKVDFYILDDLITEDIFRQVLDTAGNLIGIGRFRPINWGYYGRFKVQKVMWHTDA